MRRHKKTTLHSRTQRRFCKELLDTRRRRRVQRVPLRAALRLEIMHEVPHIFPPKKVYIRRTVASRYGSPTGYLVLLQFIHKITRIMPTVYTRAKHRAIALTKQDRMMARELAWHGTNDDVLNTRTADDTRRYYSGRRKKKVSKKQKKTRYIAQPFFLSHHGCSLAREWRVSRLWCDIKKTIQLKRTTEYAGVMMRNRACPAVETQRQSSLEDGQMPGTPS